MREFDPKYEAITSLPFPERVKAMGELNDDEAFDMFVYNLHCLGTPPSPDLLAYSKDYADRYPRTEYRPAEEPAMKQAA